MIVHSKPNKQADEYGYFVNSDSDIILYKSLEALEMKDAYQTYAVKCLPTAKIGQKEIEACRHYLKKEIETVKPKIIIALGETALIATTGLTKISSQRGGVKQGLDGVQVVPTFNPFYASSSDANIEKFANDLELAFQVLHGVEEEEKEVAKTNAVVVDTMEKVDTLIEYIKQTGRTSFDVETTKLEYYAEDAKMTSISFSFQPNSAYVIYLHHKAQCFTEEEKDALKRDFETADIDRASLDYALSVFKLRNGLNETMSKIYGTLVLMDEVFKGDAGLEGIPMTDELADAVLDNLDYVIFTDVQIKEIFKKLSDGVFMNPEVEKIAQNFKFDAEWVKTYGVEGFAGRCEDIMLMHYAIQNNRLHNLKDMVADYYPAFANYEDEKDLYPWDSIPVDIQTQYNGIDSDMTFRLSILLLDELLVDERAYIVYRNLLMPVCLNLLEVEYDGVDIDKDYLEARIEEAEEIIKEVSDELHKHPKVIAFEKEEYELAIDGEIKALEKKIEKGSTPAHMKRWEKNVEDLKTGVVGPKKYEKVKFGTNTDKLKRLFFDEHGFQFPMPYDWKKRQKVKSVKKDYMPLFKDNTGFIDGIKRINSVSHTLSNFLKGVHKLLDSKNRLHTSYKQLIETGRISSSKPNLQNIPPEGRHPDPVASRVHGFVKRCFPAPEDHYFVEVDYSQAELRLIAMYANEKNMLDIYAKGGDIHASTAARMSEMTMEEFYKLEKKDIKQRRFNAKAANFGLIYGLSAVGYQNYAETNYGLILSKAEAEEQREMFLYDMYPALPDYHDKYIAKCEKNGGVRTLLGYKRFIPEIHDDDGFKRNHAENQAVNTPIQGTAGQLTLFALVLLRKRLDKRVRVVNTVHDSIHMYVPKSLMDSSARIIRETMENLPLEDYFIGAKIEGVTMKVDFAISDKSWGDLDEVEL